MIKPRLLTSLSSIILISDPVSISAIIFSSVNFIIAFKLAAQQNTLLFLTNSTESFLSALILISTVLSGRFKDTAADAGAPIIWDRWKRVCFSFYIIFLSWALKKLLFRSLPTNKSNRVIFGTTTPRIFWINSIEKISFNSLTRLFRFWRFGRLGRAALFLKYTSRGGSSLIITLPGASGSRRFGPGSPV